MVNEKCHWAGIDVGKHKMEVGLVLFGQESPLAVTNKIPVQSFPRNPEGVQQMYAWFQKKLERTERQDLPVRSVIESTGKYSRELFDMIVTHGAMPHPAIVNPHRTVHFGKSLGLRTKTDHQDARILSLYGRERKPAAFTPLSPALQELRDLCRYRELLVRQQTAQKNLSEEGLQGAFLIKHQKQVLKNLDKQIAKLDKQIAAHIEKHDELKIDSDMLQKIPGVGKVTACVVLSEAGDLRRFNKRNQIVAFAGLNPRQRQSGSSVMGRTQLSKTGSSRLRWALYMASLSAIRVAGPLKDTYEKHVAAGKAGKCALGIVMRKLLVLMRSILVNNTKYDPDFNCG